MDTEILIIAEVGGNVGWGHLSRASLLRRILAPYFDVELNVVNRQEWTDRELRDKYAIRRRSAKLVFSDGLCLKDTITKYIEYEYLVSLSYISDVNDISNLVIAPALNGLVDDPKVYTDLRTLLCNIPINSKTNHTSVKYCNNVDIGVCFGGADVDNLGPSLASALNINGLTTRLFIPSNRMVHAYEDFLNRKLDGDENNGYPYYELSGCKLIITQGGITAVELALLNLPIVIRKRHGFGNAYHFLKKMKLAEIFDKNDLNFMVDTIMELVEEDLQINKIHSHGAELLNRIDHQFWIEFCYMYFQGKINVRIL